jgi:hypothetical protein
MGGLVQGLVGGLYRQCKVLVGGFYGLSEVAWSWEGLVMD